jgi:hypothetical protein
MAKAEKGVMGMIGEAGFGMRDAGCGMSDPGSGMSD